MNIPDKPEQYEHKLRSDSPRQIIRFVVALIFADVVSGYGWLPYLPAFVLVYMVAYLIDYWIPPKPPSSFFLWVVKITLLFGYVLICVWLIPKLLSRWIWIPLAYGVPMFVLGISTYWIPPLYPVKRVARFQRTLIWAIALAVLFALWAMFFLNTDKT